MTCHCRSITASTSYPPNNTGARSSQGDPSDRWMRQPGCLTGPMAVGGMAGASRYLRVLLNKNAKGHHPRLLLAPLPSGLRQVGSSSPRPCLVLDALRRNIDDTIVRGLGETRKETKKLDCCQNNIFRSNMFCQRGSELTAVASSTSGRISGSGTCRGGSFNGGLPNERAGAAYGSQPRGGRLVDERPPRGGALRGLLWLRAGWAQRSAWQVMVMVVVMVDGDCW